MLRGKIEDCQALIHIVGVRYGGEPDPATLPTGAARRSYTQMEYDIGRALQTERGDQHFRVYTFVCPPDFPYDTEAQHLVSSVANSSLNQPLSTAAWPWQPDQTYYVRFVNTAATAQAITFTLNGKNALTEDEDNDRLPDQWELQHYPNIHSYNATSDIDKDGANNLAEWACSLNPTRPDIAALTPGTGTAGLPVARLTGSAGNQRLTIEFVCRKNASLTYTVQFAGSPAGASFLAAVNAPTVTPIDANWERVIVEDSVTTGDQAIRFGRVRVTAP